jgi:phospholipase/carboxylesterase
MSETEDPLLEATTALVPALLTGLEALAYAGRHLHPPQLPGLIESLDGFDDKIAAGKTAFDAAPWPEHLHFFRDQLNIAADAALRAFGGLKASADDPNGMLKAYRSMRHSTRAVEALYPMSFSLPAINRFFVDVGQRDDEALWQALNGADPSREDVGIMNANNDREQRGGFSMYVPEYYDPGQAMPLIVALHGGSGHGADFLWTWLREARSRGCIVLSPTARQDTWSLMGPDVDSAPIGKMIEHVMNTWSVDQDRVLLTGMSDGATFTLVSALGADTPYTHLAPISGSFHPMLLDGASDLSGRPIYLTHGALDWMFPVDIARMARDALSAAGADVIYREIADLSHTYPRDENPRILDWLIDGRRPPSDA